MIILTGGAGFIGANTLRALNQAGHKDILVVDNVGETAKWRNLVGCEFHEYVHKNTLWEWLKHHPDVSLDAVFHLGACSDTMQYDFDYLVVNNVQYSQKLWQLCTQRRVPLIYASSAATYGDGSSGFSDDHEVTDDYKPINQYGYSKQLFDLWALKQDASPPFWYGLKFFNVYGPYEDHKGRMASVIKHALPQVLEKGRIRLFKSYRKDFPDGGQKRDFVFVGDVVDIMVNFLETPVPSGLYNAGSGTAQTFNDLAEAVFKAVNRPLEIEYFDMPESLRATYQYFTEADMNKLRTLGIDYKPTSLEEGAKIYCEWMLNRKT